MGLRLLSTKTQLGRPLVKPCSSSACGVSQLRAVEQVYASHALRRALCFRLNVHNCEACHYRAYENARVYQSIFGGMPPKIKHHGTRGVLFRAHTLFALVLQNAHWCVELSIADKANARVINISAYLVRMRVSSALQDLDATCLSKQSSHT